MAGGGVRMATVTRQNLLTSTKPAVPVPDAATTHTSYHLLWLLLQEGGGCAVCMAHTLVTPHKGWVACGQPVATVLLRC